MSSILTDHLQLWGSTVAALLAILLARPKVVWIGKGARPAAGSRTLRVEMRVTMRTRRDR